MGLNCGIVGLPNVGKSTIFNALTSAKAASANYPFCTIDPNVGVVSVPDIRMDKIAEIISTEKIVPTIVEFVDIAGLVKGASKGEGLGNQFLGHIKNVNALLHVVRCFEKSDTIHVEGSVHPERDIDIINTELILADIETVDKRLNRSEKLAKTGDKKNLATIDVLKKVKNALNNGVPVRLLCLTDEEKADIADLHLITSKPVLYVANIFDIEQDKKYIDAIAGFSKKENSGFVVISGDIESEIAQMEPSERKTYYEEMGLQESGLEKLIRETYQLLGFITYFTAGPKEIRAWTILQGTKAPQAAGVIHSDFERGFIRAEIYNYNDLITLGSEQKIKEKGLLRLEGKDYVMKDGDIVHFRFNV
ncbi:putative GTP-binding protein [Candidatus Kuenenia stuttgartiensis]|uniref:Ribosome-binding ATPase YchF n=1 Tax=Kuenenia stuttgartiensis TaxID=174633 RepID=Q1PWD1_KUEST|nr:redox-regulated ATPase YchF [Candidatus Kuenenia stuttgartiensis]MCF6152701.1 redox-regulated ATPase YchF [Candidatus Kuenenia stuttgartiensis]QII13990.1 putative GTP-binding protein [Candidatus Kuenenia stuttgartiensis]CAJ71529.1 strongly similar to GTP-binding protein [Candidatus Kuenenia stuttgartiensis]